MSFNPYDEIASQQPTLSDAERLKITREAEAREQQRIADKKAQQEADRLEAQRKAQAEFDAEQKRLSDEQAKIDAQKKLDEQKRLEDERLSALDVPYTSQVDTTPIDKELGPQQDAVITEVGQRFIDEKKKIDVDDKLGFGETDGLMGPTEPPLPPTTSLTTSDLRLTPEQQLELGFGGTVSGDLFFKGQEQTALAEQRRKEGNIIGSILAGSSGLLLQAESGIIAPFESLLEIVPEKYQPTYFKGKNVPDIFGAVLGSGLESYEEGKLVSSAEATFLQENPLFTGASVIGETLLGVGIGGGLKVAGKGTAKGAKALSTVVKEPSPLKSLFGVPLKVTEKLGIGGSKGIKLTDIKQTGVIKQTDTGFRLSDVYTETKGVTTKLTSSEADALKRLGFGTKPIGIEVIGTQKTLITGGKGVKFGVKEGTFEFLGEGAESALGQVKKIDISIGKPGVKLTGTSYIDELISLSGGIEKSAKVPKIGIDIFPPGTKKVVPKEGFSQAYLDEVSRFVGVTPSSKLGGKGSGFLQRGAEDIPLFKEGYVELVQTVSGKTKKFKDTTRGGLGLSKKTTGKITTTKAKSTIKGFPSTERTIKFETIGKPTAIISEKIPRLDDVFKGGKIGDYLDFRPPLSELTRLGDDLVIKQGRKIIKPEDVGIIKKIIEKPTPLTKKDIELLKSFGYTKSDLAHIKTIQAEKVARELITGSTKKLGTIDPSSVVRAGAGVKAGTIVSYLTRLSSIDKRKIDEKQRKITDPTSTITVPKLDITGITDITVKPPTDRTKKLGQRYEQPLTYIPDQRFKYIPDTRIDQPPLERPSFDPGITGGLIRTDIKIPDLDLIRTPFTVPKTRDIRIPSGRIKIVPILEPIEKLKEVPRLDQPIKPMSDTSLKLSPFLDYRLLLKPIPPRTPTETKTLIVPFIPYDEEEEFKKRRKAQIKWLKSLKKHPINYDPLGLFTVRKTNKKSSKSTKSRRRKR